MRCSFILKHRFMILTIGFLTLGILLGVIVNVFKAPAEAIVWISLPGELFMRALRFCVIPLLSCNIISVAAGANLKTQGKLASIALAYCIMMNIISSVIGGVMTLLIRPGDYVSTDINGDNETSTEVLQVSDVFADTFRNMVPDNFVQIFISSVVTGYKYTNTGTNDSVMQVTRVLNESPGVNILGLLVSSLFIGLVAGSLIEDVDVFVQFFTGATKVLTRLLNLAMKFLPIGMGSLVFNAIAEIDEAVETLKALGMFVAASCAYLSILAFILLPVVYIIFTRRNPVRLYVKSRRTILTAFSTLSSLVSLPDVFRVCESEGMHMDTAYLLGPFLTSFNANGSSAFIASSIFFCAQWTNNNVGLGNTIGIIILVGFNVMALPSVPSASIVLVMLLVRVFGISETAIPFLFVTEFIIDRLRTPVNVLSHTVCLLIVNHFECRLENKDSTSMTYFTGDDTDNEQSIEDLKSSQTHVNKLC